MISSAFRVVSVWSNGNGVLFMLLMRCTRIELQIVYAAAFIIGFKSVVLCVWTPSIESIKRNLMFAVRLKWLLESMKRVVHTYADAQTYPYTKWRVQYDRLACCAQMPCKQGKMVIFKQNPNKLILNLSPVVVFFCFCCCRSLHVALSFFSSYKFSILSSRWMRAFAYSLSFQLLMNKYNSCIINRKKKYLVARRMHFVRNRCNHLTSFAQLIFIVILH